ncbi:hypothetical protein J1614_003890 [Plenodomus biglobosus]|nr:hypothetical protein J1614_003890 [Plenodomus biglobosus]
MSQATAGDRSTPDIDSLMLGATDGHQPSPPLTNMPPADSEPQMHVNSLRKMPYIIPPHPTMPRSPDERPFNHGQEMKSIPSLRQMTKEGPRYPDLLLQPDYRPISQKQLAFEVKSIYAGLKTVETKCIEVDHAQSAAAHDNSDTNSATEHWQALVALHRTLLHEHHNCKLSFGRLSLQSNAYITCVSTVLLASQLPLATPYLKLAVEYSMPSRMWSHGIYSILELLRRRLPDSIDYLLEFIYFAYQMMALIYETVPAFEITWIECLGDLGRYRMAIEDEDVHNRETWAGVARSWYKKAAYKNPTVGRLYHHLAILARPNALEQLYYYARSLTSVKSFSDAHESFRTLLDPILGRATAINSHVLPIDTSFIKAHALLFDTMPMEKFQITKQDFMSNLDNHIELVTVNWKTQGVYIAVTNIAGAFEYGKNKNLLRQAFLTHFKEKLEISPRRLKEIIHTASPADQQGPDAPSMPACDLLEKLQKLDDYPFLKAAISLTNETFSLVLRRDGDNNVLPHVLIMLACLTTFAANEYVSHLLVDVPWTELVTFLNTLVKDRNQSESQHQTQIQDINTLLSADVFPGVDERTDEIPLPEDYLVRGLI